ncbi:MAG: hypothetical protein ACXWH0_10225 [Acidimicrobiia bacterium]
MAEDDRSRRPTRFSAREHDAHETPPAVKSESSDFFPPAALNQTLRTWECCGVLWWLVLEGAARIRQNDLLSLE